jgi:antitoxin component YwqK of YwqJK toxin-antitoxin module
MDLKERLEFCRKCVNREFNSELGIVCGLTNQKPAFTDACHLFIQDNTVTAEKEIHIDEEQPLPQQVVIAELGDEQLEKLRVFQDFNFALVGGLLAAILGAVVWAVITVATKYQIGYMAIGVGLLVGFGVRFFGSGIDKKFGILGAFLSMLGCLAGNYLSQVGFYAMENSMNVLEVLGSVSLSLIPSILLDSASPMDLLFYGIALFAGYRYAFRNVTASQISGLHNGTYDGTPQFEKFRIPLVAAGIIIIVALGYFSTRGANGEIVNYYDSGSVMSKGQQKNGLLHGLWINYYENGKIASEQEFDNGVENGFFRYYSEDGLLLKEGAFVSGLEHGIWKSYHLNGKLADSGLYNYGRVHGNWNYFYDNGLPFLNVNFDNNRKHGNWHVFSYSGNVTTQGQYKNDLETGKWKYYNEYGVLREEIIYRADSTTSVIFSTDIHGNETVKKGFGTQYVYYPDGSLSMKINIENGIRTGKAQLLYQNGKVKEEGVFEKNIFRILNAWDPDGSQTVTDGNGNLYYYNTDSIVPVLAEAGAIVNGLRQGVWKQYHFQSGKIMAELEYDKGKEHGFAKSYHESGELAAEGRMRNNKRHGDWTWYNEDGSLSSTVSYENGRKKGEQKLYNHYGGLARTEYYEDDKLVKEEMN